MPKNRISFPTCLLHILYNLVIKVISDEIMIFWAIKCDDKYKFLM